MEFNEFIKMNKEIWHKYFLNFFRLVSSHNIYLQGNGSILYPNIALFTVTKEHYIMELLGSQKYYEELKIKRHKESSTMKYLYQFEYKHFDQIQGIFHLNTRGTRLKNLGFSRQVDLDNLNKRFQFNNLWKTNIMYAGEGNGSLLTFGKDFKSCFIDNCLFVNSLEEVYRAKHVVHMTIINKNYSKTKYRDELEKMLYHQISSTNDLYGMQYCENNKQEALIMAGQFANIFLVPGIRETTIGEFLKQNPNFIKIAFGCEGFLYESEFEWIEGNLDPSEKTINPDLLLERNDGYYNICDLKLPELDKKSLTTGEHKRRTFIAKVNSGIAQLANYADYFTYPKNQKLAKEKNNVEVLNPELILIVGNYENLTASEIKEAMRALKDNYKIIDYDTLNTLFLSNVLKNQK